MAKFGAFYDTKQLFIEYTQYAHSLTYDEWLSEPDDHKAALLFIQFYSEITLAWEKADSIGFGDDMEGVTTILQYLEKHVNHLEYYLKDNPTKKANAEYRRQHPDGYITINRHMIAEDPKKFSGAYIYRVAYNCLYCICGHDRQCDKDRIANEVSNTAVVDGVEFDLYDTVVDWDKSVDVVADRLHFEAEFWAVVESEGATAEKVMRYLLTNNPSFLKSLSRNDKKYKLDPLRDISVSIDEVDTILNKLRDKFLSLPTESPCGSFLTEVANLDESLLYVS